MRIWLVVLVLVTQLTAAVAEAAHVHLSPDGQDEAVLAGQSGHHHQSGHHQSGQPAAHHGCDRCSHGLGHSVVGALHVATPTKLTAQPLTDLPAGCRDEWCPALPFKPPR